MITTADAQVIASLARLQTQGLVTEYALTHEGATSGVVVRMFNGRTAGIAWPADKPVKDVLRSLRKHLERC